MVKLSLGVILTLGLLVQSGIAQQQPHVPSTADDLLALVAEALGGRERLARVENVYTRVRFAVASLEGTGEGWTTARGASRSSYEIAGVNRGVTVFDGERAFVRDANGKVAERTGPELLGVVTSAYLGSYSHLVPGRMAGDAKLVGVDPATNAYVVEIAPRGGIPVTIHVDRTSHLPTQMVLRTGTTTQVTTFSDWRDVDGVKLAFASTQSTGDPKTEVRYTVEEARLDEKLAADLFSRPEEAKPEAAFAKGRSALGIPFELTSNHIYVQVRVDGSEPLWFLLDSGAETSVINLARAKALGLKMQGGLQARGYGEGTLEAALVERVSVELPGVRIPTKTVVAIPLTALEPYDGRPMDGILGYDMIGGFVLRIDYARKTLDLFDPAEFVYDGKGARVPFEFHSNIPTIRAAVRGDGRERLEGRFTVDTGARQALSLHRPFVASSWLDELAAKALDAPHGVGVGGETKTRVGRVGALEVGPYRIERPVSGFEFDTKGAGANPDVAGNIGGEILRRFTVTFDYSRRAIYLEPNADFVEPFEYDMLGVQLTTDDGGFAVRRVVAGSAAAAAGIREGDRVVAVDGTPVSTLTLEEVRRRFRSDGREVRLVVRRDGGEREVKVVLRRLV